MTPNFDNPNRLAQIEHLFYNAQMSDLENPLTRREITILRYVAQGMNSRAIARQIHLQPRTIHYYFGVIKSKLNASSMEEVMFIAGRESLLGDYQPGDEV
jgi:DNA-binding NarL/FixJ family response regulator